MKQKIFITGGAGYIGSVLIPMLLNEGYEVTLYDSLKYESHHLIPWFSNKNFKFIKGDILDVSLLRKSMVAHDVVIHLAAIVGYGACRQDENAAYLINHVGTKNVIECSHDNQYLIYASTSSNYGEIKEGICTEDSPLNPLSIYGKSKTLGEDEVRYRKNSTCFRFATAFGVSPRMRLDLLLNDLVYLAKSQKYLVVYESHFMRSFIHVQDIARVFLFALKNKESMTDNVYNVGSNSMNYSKKDICDLIKDKTQCYVNYADFDNDADKRNYLVSYDKLESLGYGVTKSLVEGIDELIDIYDVLQIKIPFKN